MPTQIFGSIDQAWSSVVGRLRGARAIESRNGPMHEILGMSFCVNDLRHNVLTQECRKFSKRYAVAELIWYLSGESSVEMISHYAPSYAQYAEEDGHAYGAYGERWKSQIDGLIDHLKDHDIDNTRRAVISSWHPRDIDHLDKRDVPCTLTLQFIPREGFLHLVVNMRSNDAWLGLPYDVFCFTTLLKIIAAHTGYQVGKYYHFVGSMHLYEKDASKIKDLQIGRPRTSPVFDDTHTGTFGRTRKVLVEAEKLLRTTGKIPMDLPRASPLEAGLINELVKTAHIQPNK